MPLYEFEYYDQDGTCHTFEKRFPMDHDFSTVMSPCGKFQAHKIISSFSKNEGLTAKQKSAGTTKRRVQVTEFVKEQRRIRQKNHAPGTREHDSNEIWTGKEGKI